MILSPQFGPQKTKQLISTFYCNLEIQIILISTNGVKALSLFQLSNELKLVEPTLPKTEYDTLHKTDKKQNAN